jgi:GT2 family glycosyltransferase
MRRGLNTDALSLSNAPKAPADVSAIVINQNGGEPLFRCLDSLSRQTGITLETAVVDNASAEAERHEIASRFPEMRLITFSSNLGFARAANEGIARTSGKFILLVNNDARLAPDYAARLAARISLDERLAGGQGIVLRPDGLEVDTAGLSWNSRGEALPRFSGCPRFEAPTGAVELSGVSATAALYRRSALEEIAPGGRVFDDSFFAYYEDVDLALRLARAGWRFVLDPEAIAFHEGSMTGARTPWRRARWTARNRWRTLLKNFDRSFLRRRLADLLRADLAHARSLGLAGVALLAAVWPAALAASVTTRQKGPLLTGFPCS